MGRPLGAPAGPLPAYRAGRAVAECSVAWRQGMGGKVVLKEPELEETVNPQPTTEGPTRPEQWKRL